MLLEECEDRIRNKKAGDKEREKRGRKSSRRIRDEWKEESGTMDTIRIENFIQIERG